MGDERGGIQAVYGSELVEETSHHRNSIFSQRLDRTTFTAYFLGAVVPLLALGFVVDRYVIPTIPEKGQIIGMIALVSSIAILSLLSFLVLRKTTHSTLARIDRDNRRLSALLGASTNLTASEYASDIATTSVACAVELTGAQAAYLLVRGKDPEEPAELFESAGTDIEKLFKSIGGRITELAELAMNSGRPAIKNGSGNRGGLVVLPLAGESSWLGVLAVVHARSASEFEGSRMDALTTLAGLTSVAMRNADLRDSQRNFFSHMTEILVTALDVHLDYNNGHGTRVAQTANRVGRAMNLDDGRLQNLHFASLLHDIGMLKFDKSIHKGDKVCQKHAEIGYRMLVRIRLWEDVAPIVHCHHERYDGTGYPQGLAGEEISLEARIITLCDAFDAMTSNSSYKAAMSFEAAVEEVRSCTGTQFDPRVSEAFLDLVAQGAISDP
jgi:HD-GYP domain-containing protein (c-di-GMP phosphodiesterase class II)